MTAHQQAINTHWDAIVIGSGVGGMTAAAFLATNGKRVLVLEQHSVLGGSSHVFRRKKQWEFDVGMHYVGDCGSDGQMPRIFRSLGLEGRMEFLPMEPTGFDTIVFPDVSVKVPVGWDNYLANLIQAFPKEEKNLRKFVKIVSSVGFAIDRSRSPASLANMAKMAFDAKLAAAWALLPVAKLLDHCQLSPTARSVVSVQFGLYGCPPSRAPVVVHAGLLHNYIHGGAWYPKGGGQVFSAYLYDVLKQHNGTAMTSALVQRIIMEHGRVAGVQLKDGQEFRAPIIVSNADLKKTYLELIGAEHLPNGLVKKEMPAFIHCGSIKDPDNPHHAPKGCSSLEAMYMMPRGRQFWTSAKAGEKYSRDPQYLDLKEQLTELMIQRTEAVIPAIKGKILWKEASTPLTQGHYTYSTDDTAYGLECNIKQFGPFRPRSRTPVKGLFICGTSTAWGPSIEGSVISGMQAAAAVLDRDLDAEIRSGKIYGDPSILTSGGTGWDPLKTTSNLNKKAKVVNVDEGCDRH